MKAIYKHISLTLKELRRQKGWSLDKAAEKTGVSKAMLGQIEREESSPTIATLWKIASGFDTSFSSFIEEISSEFNKPVYRSGQTQQLHSSDEKIRVMPLFPFDEQLKCEIFVIELLPTCEHLSPPHQTGVIEHVIVAEGKMEVLVNGIWQPLNKGEGLRFDANQPHGYRNISAEIATFHDVIHYPKAGKILRNLNLEKTR
ncbi:MAG: XRE family transcriptional regulator [Gammaproteobacteria bacterium]|nr:MAG: XRE family transcriptional regulator [Gammaproteobacteria bacterium]